MVVSRESFSLLPVHFVLVLGALIGLIVVVNAYGTNNPSVFGHSSDEIEYAFTVYTNDCSGNPYMGVCQMQCQVSGETAVSGSCETSRGWGNLFMGTLVDGITYQCIDASFIPGSTRLVAQVVCVR